MVATTTPTEAVLDALLLLARRTADLEDMEVLTEGDAMRVRDLKAAVGEVMETTTDLLRLMREEA
jgi:hypothetical protein